jgi:hypothetical protein
MASSLARTASSESAAGVSFPCAMISPENQVAT